jgi:uncharacterized membrane protein YfcA
LILIECLLLGIVSGVIAGMGMGGGTLLIPLVTLFLGVNQKLAQGLNLLSFLPMAIISIYIHFKNRLIDFKIGSMIISSGIVFSLISSIIATLIVGN